MTMGKEVVDYEYILQLVFCMYCEPICDWTTDLMKDNI